MEDSGIVALYLARDERAVAETAEKYGGRCYAVSYQILRSREDAEECVNDTYVKTWNAIPPQRPHCLGAFVQKIARNLALTAYQAARAQKRGGGQPPAPLQELADCVTGNPEAAVEQAELSRILDQFLRTLPDRDQYIFMRRYWFFDSCAEIARISGLSEKNVSVRLTRLRKKLRIFLEENEVYL